MESILRMLPSEIVEHLRMQSVYIMDKIEEIRLRIGRPVELSVENKPIFLPVIFQQLDASLFLERIANYSFYTLDEELKNGYITVEGGHRIGLAGKVILDKGKVQAIRHISSFNVRIAREKIGVGLPLVNAIYQRKWLQTMIVGAPQSGKTTILRDLARIISTGIPEKGISPLKVGIVDERSEIAGCANGIPQLQFGDRIDVLDACPKAEGMMMLIRSMSPDVIIVDEIGREEDSDAILEAANAGITVIMTVHGHTISDIKKRPFLKKIVEQQLFKRIVEISRANGPGTFTNVLNESFQSIPVGAR